MAKFFFMVIFLQVLNIWSTWSACVWFNDCPLAQKHIRIRPNDPETVRIFRKAHCGSRYENKIRCEEIPDLDVTEGCVLFSDCPQALKLLYSPNSEDKRLLKSSYCNDSSGKVMVMCDNLTDKSSATDLLPKSNECGLLPPGPKLYGAQRAELEDFPWLALLKYRNGTGHISYRCHGSLISDRYVVTAAHCLSQTSADKRKYGSLKTIVLGEYDITTSQDCLFLQYGGFCADPVQEFSAQSIHIHPDFESDGAPKDIALVRLNASAKFSATVKPICLPLKPLVLSQNENFLVSGWGETETRSMSNVKLKARLRLLPNDKCAIFQIGPTQICAGSSFGKDTCRGDSGGPLMVVRTFQDEEMRAILAGVVSFGAQCGGGAAVYTNVTAFVSWIVNTIHK